MVACRPLAVAFGFYQEVDRAGLPRIETYLWVSGGEKPDRCHHGTDLFARYHHRYFCFPVRFWSNLLPDPPQIRNFVAAIRQMVDSGLGLMLLFVHIVMPPLLR